jgi:cell division protein DivIC
MSIQDRADKILTFRHSSMPAPKSAKQVRRHKLHPGVRRRRWLWLITMVTVTGWAMIHLLVQQFHIWNKEEQLATKMSEVTTLEQKTKELEKAVYQLKYDEEYLNELAHEKGYSKPGEEMYWIKEKE